MKRLIVLSAAAVLMASSGGCHHWFNKGGQCGSPAPAPACGAPACGAPGGYPADPYMGAPGGQLQSRPGSNAGELSTMRGGRVGRNIPPHARLAITPAARTERQLTGRVEPFLKSEFCSPARYSLLS